ncbi:MAG: hypothetical protein K940chlam3_00353 [Chlamydiae bacterium]|nr:hypothetical protein [Chlamydiota bacterium]
MLEVLKQILEVQELDMKMIRLMRLKKERQRELKKLNRIKEDLKSQVTKKDEEILKAKSNVKLMELEIQEVVEKIAKLDSQQSAIKKVDEFNALTQEISAAEKQRHAKEQVLGDMMDRLAADEEVLSSLQESFDQTVANSKDLEDEIYESIRQINTEGQGIKKERDQKVKGADPEVLTIYERLLRNKRNRVIVPIENRCCSGCHIMLTAQDENLVRKGERLLFCEHCSRIHFWQESEELEGTPAAPKRRRRPSRAKS